MKTKTEAALASAPADAPLDAMRLAWEHTREARSTITREQLASPTFDMRVALATIRASHARALPYRDRLVHHLRGFDPRCVDQLLTYCDAMDYGHGRAQPEPRESPVEMNAAAEKHLAKLMRALTPLADAGYFPASVLDEIRAGSGWHDRADDLSRIVIVATDCWSELEGRTTLTKEDLATALTLSRSLYAYLGNRSEPEEPSDVQLERRQAITLTMQAYEELRRGLAWLRWHEKDLQKIAPSVYTTSRTKRGGDDATASDEEQEGEPALDAKKPTDAPKPADAKKPADAPKPQGESSLFAKRIPAEDDVPTLGKNGLPLVPQDDPFAKD